MRVHVRSLAVVLVLFLAFTARQASAQTTYATITGTVTDGSGAVIQGATVVATNVETGVTTTTTTNHEGVYAVLQLREGPYLLSIKAQGLREFIETNILLVGNAWRAADSLALRDS